MRLLLRVLSLILVLAIQSAGAQTVGFQTVSIPATGSSSIPVNIWYPSTAQATQQSLGLFEQVVALNGPVQGTRLGLIVISHGTGGTKDGHYDTALALAKGGFVVAALEHSGDNYRDQSRATDMLSRPRELGQLIDYMLREWAGRTAIDSGQVGAFGFSSGGFTVLASAGGEPDLSLVAPHCLAHPKFFDCSLVKAHPQAPPKQGAPPQDARIKALVVAAPALGFTFAHGLAGVTQPVQLWRADDDHVLPAPEYADAVRRALPRPPEFHAVPGADHYDFLAPCTQRLAQIAPAICTSEPGFDRVAFHKSFNDAVVTFFKAQLH